MARFATRSAGRAGGPMAVERPLCDVCPMDEMACPWPERCEGAAEWWFVPLLR